MKSFILTYHSIDSTGSVISIAPQVFRAHMKTLAASGHPVVQLRRVGQVEGAVAITFDDGFRNFYEHALPVLREFGLPATVFVVTGHCGGKNDWTTQPAGIPVLDLMDWTQLSEAVRHGVTLGAHTVTHSDLMHLSSADVARELAQSKAEIEDRIGSEVDSCCYPYGSTNASVRQIAGGIFRRACGTSMRYVDGASDPLELPRLDAYYLRNPFWLERAGGTLGASYVGARHWIRKVRQMCGV